MEKQERNKHAEKKKKGQKEKEEEREREVRSADLNSGLCSTQKNYVTSVKNQRSSESSHIEKQLSLELPSTLSIITLLK